jgi:phosphoenolpyruvate synthase/pyruvate phosphate dikinase
MPIVMPLTELPEESRRKVGKKAFNLGKLYSAGYDIPPGFVISSSAYKEFIVTTEIKDTVLGLMKSVRKDFSNLEDVSKELQAVITKQIYTDAIKNAILSNYSRLGNRFVVIRPAAGSGAKLLNIKGDINLLEAVKQCWASLFTPENLKFRLRNKVKHGEDMTLIVQEMIYSKKSGVMYTMNPLNNSKEKIVIKAVYGLIDVMESGQIDYSSYILNKSDGKIVSRETEKQEFGLFKDWKKDVLVKKTVPQTEVLSYSEIQELAKLGQSV